MKSTDPNVRTCWQADGEPKVRYASEDDVPAGVLVYRCPFHGGHPEDEA